MSTVSHHRREGKRAAAVRLNRETFRTNRELDFFSRRELVTQTGHDVPEWLLVFIKEAGQRPRRL
jgi:hypothetical protein